jgi:hypothetical protein
VFLEKKKGNIHIKQALGEFYVLAKIFLRSSINSVLVDNKINNQNRVGAKTPGGRFQEIECKITMGAV